MRLFNLKYALGLVLSLLFLLAGCNLGGGPAPTPTVEEQVSTETVAPFTVIRATRTPLPNRLPPTPTTLNLGGGGSGSGGGSLPPTAVIPPTEIDLTGPLPNTRLLDTGIGLSDGRVMRAGEFQVEGYCTVLNAEYRADEDGNDWYCTFNGQRALTLRANDFSEICRRTYNNPEGYAVQINNGQPAAYRWRCLESMNNPTPTPSGTLQLLQNGRGLSTGRPVSNGEFEVEAYCTSINASYGVDEDGTFWYCTQNGQRVLTLGRAEFDDICFRTYNVPGAFAEPLNNGDRLAYRWRCYAYVTN